MFFAFGFIFEGDLKSINIPIEDSKQGHISNTKNEDSDCLDFIKASVENIIKDVNNNKSFNLLNEVYKFSESIMYIAISNVTILEEYDNFKIACGVIAYTREILLERNSKRKTQEANELELENSYNYEKIEEAKRKVNSSISLDEEELKFKWNDKLERDYAIAFKEFQPQYEIIKR